MNDSSDDWERFFESLEAAAIDPLGKSAAVAHRPTGPLPRHLAARAHAMLSHLEVAQAQLSESLAEVREQLRAAGDARRRGRLQSPTPATLDITA